jgi:hypothetical protein
MTEERHVFVLGAGFSHAVHRAMPTVKGLVKPLDDTLRGDAAPIAGIANHIRLKRGDPSPDVEALLSSLAVPQPFLSEHENLLNQALFVALSRWLARYIFEQQEQAVADLAPWLTDLVKVWARGPATHIITLNYDSLVEWVALSHLSNGAPGDPTILVDPREPDAYWGPRARLLKLHGSVTWFFPGPSYGPTSAFKDLFGWSGPNIGPHPMTWDQLTAHAEGLVPLLVPPVTAKSTYFDHPLIRKAWLDARQALDAATCVYILGYSLPAADLQMRALLAEGTRDKPVVLINVDRSLEQHFMQMLYDPSSVDTKFLGEPTPIERFVNDYRTSGQQNAP